MRFADFKTPSTLEEARTVLKQLGKKGVPLAGATSMVFVSDAETATAVDVSRLGLEGIRREDDVFVIGAGTRIAALQKFHESGWVLDEPAKHLATQQIRNISTIGGNIARVFPWADLPIALLALNATMIIDGDEERTLGADEYFASQPMRLFAPGDILTKIIVPVVASGFGYRKETRTSADFSLATAAAKVEVAGGRIVSSRIALGAAIPTPARIKAVEEALAGVETSAAAVRAATEKAIADRPIRQSGGLSKEYIKHLASVVICDAVMSAVTSGRLS